MLPPSGSIIFYLFHTFFTASTGGGLYCRQIGLRVGMVRGPLLEYALQGVRVNAACPGFIEHRYGDLMPIRLRHAEQAEVRPWPFRQRPPK